MTVRNKSSPTSATVMGLSPEYLMSKQHDSGAGAFTLNG
jgi:hypothetical protein